VGKRLRRLRGSERVAILTSLGRHQRFTEVVFQLFSDLYAETIAACRGRSSEEILRDIEGGGVDAAWAVCGMLVEGRGEEAATVAAWALVHEAAVQDAHEPESGVQAEAREGIDALSEPAAEHREFKRLRRRLEEASAQFTAAQRRAAQAADRARRAQEQLDEASAVLERLGSRVAELESQVEAGRRQRRDLRAELEDLQERFRRLRRELKETRARVPADVPAEVTVHPPFFAAPEAAPSLAELVARLRTGGEAGVLEAKRLFVIVDGWNVGLGQIGAERLEDKRRLLEQALQRYQSRTGNRVMVVYDGRKVNWFWVPRATRGGVVRVFTSEGEAADDYIVSELEGGTDGQAAVVVTSDQELERRCRALGAFVVSSEGLARSLGL
ncbi:MAG: NYN domain-containing protein, partial [Candidatus Methylomirabilales bacterium]